ncbi:MetS family NSS transporter small subunit [uncultured Clostridium sp.]|nr:MetS family NSS transporter small subunit [uncultured Clostridium sp.]
MTETSIIFFLIGAGVLWGGFGVSLKILLKNEKEEVVREKDRKVA